jgi:hypothetical protein
MVIPLTNLLDGNKEIEKQHLTASGSGCNPIDITIL